MNERKATKKKQQRENFTIPMKIVAYVVASYL